MSTEKKQSRVAPAKEPPKSGPIQLLDICWRHNREGTSKSWLRLNQSMRAALFLALEAGMEFHEDDFRYMSKNMRIGYWAGDLEDFYRMAVLYRVPSAWKAFEKYHGRKPFIHGPATVKHNYGGGKMGGGPARLVVGAEFWWQGERVHVTSFKDGGAEPYFTACSYTRTDSIPCPTCHGCITYSKEELKHRFKITHEDLRKARQERKLAEAAAAIGKVA
jgi:hypothetical protein